MLECMVILKVNVVFIMTTLFRGLVTNREGPNRMHDAAEFSRKAIEHGVSPFGKRRVCGGG